MKQEVRENNSWDIDFSCEAFPPRILEPLSNRERREKNPTRLPPDKIKCIHQPRYKSGYHQSDLTGQIIQLVRKRSSSALTTSVTSPKNLDTDNLRGIPKNGAEPPRFPEIERCWTTHLDKKTH